MAAFSAASSHIFLHIWHFGSLCLWWTPLCLIHPIISRRLSLYVYNKNVTFIQYTSLALISAYCNYCIDNQ